MRKNGAPVSPSIKQLALLLLLVIAFHGSHAGHLPGSQGLSSSDTISRKNDILKTAGELTDLYGSLRFKAGVLFIGESGVQDNASRIGIKGAVPIVRGVEAIMQFEVGVGLVGNKTTVKFSGDPGGATGEVDNVFTSRLGYAGIRTKFGQFTWGKQWSVYSDIGGWTDMFNAFGAEASGTYSAGTDGSISGSGRASNSFQYRLNLKFLEAGLQAQNRSISDSNQTFSDTYGASLVFKTGIGLKIGAAYNAVRDGVPDPEIGKPKQGDKALVGGVNFNNDRITAIFTTSWFENHEKDNLGNYFSGYGLELYSEYRLATRWIFYGGFNYLEPDEGSPAGEYRISYLDFGSAFKFGRDSKVFIEFKLDNSKNHDGTDLKHSAVSFGMFYNFSY